MKWFFDLKIGLKIGILAVLAVLALSMVGYAGYHYLLKSNENLTNMYKKNLLAVQYLNNSEAQSRHFQLNMTELILARDEKRMKEITDDMEKRKLAFTDDLNNFEKTGLDSYQEDSLKKIRDIVKAYSQDRDLIITLAKQNNKNTEDIYKIYVEKVVPAMDSFQKYNEELTDYSVKKASDENAHNKDNFEQSKLVMVTIIFISICLFIICSWIIVKFITSSLQTLVMTVEELSSGDFREKSQKILSNDEIGHLSDAMFHMRINIHKLLSQINASSEQLAASSEELSASAEQSAQAATQIASTVTTVAFATEKQLKLANDTNNTVSSISTAIEQMAKNAEVVSVSAEKATTAANDGEKAVEKVVGQMNVIDQKTNATAAVIMELEEKSKQIGQIVDVISNVAGQTNLLALNAAIEAARAGEQGRGFSVVAEEVRKLAEQSQDAAKQIADLIHDVQVKTENAVTFMMDGKKEVDIGSRIVMEAGDSFKEVLGMVRSVTDQIYVISASVEKVSSGSQEVVYAMQEIDQESKKTAEGTQTISAATQEQSASMQEIASSSHALSDLAAELQKSVTAFQV